MKNKEASNLLEIRYGKECMATNLTKEITYHHIQKANDGGKATVDNGARLQVDIHQWLHCACEYQDKELFNLINECLQLYKQCIDKGNKELIKQYKDEVIPEFRKILGIK